MTRVNFTNLIAKAPEDQKNLADVTSDEAVKVSLTEGVKHRSERQTQHSPSSPMEFDTVHSVQDPVMTDGEYGLNAVHLLRPAMANEMAPSSVYNAIPVQQNRQRNYKSTPLTME